MKFQREDRALVYRNEAGDKLAEITWKEGSQPDTIAVDHTYVSPDLRGQGVAEKLLDSLVEEAVAEGKLIKAVCPYVVSKFREQPEKYDHINVDAKK